LKVFVLEIKKIAVNIVLSAIIHVAFLAFLFSFRDSKPLPDSRTNIPLITLISSQTSPRQIADALQPQASQNNRGVPLEPKNTQNFEQIVPVSKNNETAEISENNESEFADVLDGFSDVFDNFLGERVKSLENLQTDSPKPLYMPKIPYPRAAKTAKIEGVAEISYTIDTTGRVVSVRLLSIPHVSFEKTIEKSVLSWRFSPATKNGKPVAINANQTIVFKLE
jgi:TonB family protein